VTATVVPSVTSPVLEVGRLLSVETPFGRPVHWAEVALVTDIGDSHELNDDRCLVVTQQELGAAPRGKHDFMLCLLADGATGSTFKTSNTIESANATNDGDLEHAGWRASQLAQAAFVESFLASREVDILDRLKDGLRAADRALIDSAEGTLSTTLVALFLAADGTAYAASIGDSVLLVLPPQRKTPDERRLQKLGYEDSTSVGSGDTTLSSVDQDQLIEQWWPHKEGGANTSMRVEPGTYLVLMSDGISDNLPAAAIDQLLRRYPLERATIGLPLHTRERRLQTQKHEGGSTQQLGLDNMSAIVVRFDGPRRGRRSPAKRRAEAGSLVSVLGTHGGPTPDAGGQFGMICLAGREGDATVAPVFLRRFIESEHKGAVTDRLSAAFMQSMPQGDQARFAVLAVDGAGRGHTFSSGGARVGPGR
jgi:serine/threonine protein phosphatase PrpC